MKTYRRVLEVLAIIAALSGSALWCQSQAESIREQKIFDAKYEDQKGQFNTEFLPPDIRKLLAEDIEVRKAYDSKYLEGWFSSGLDPIAKPGGSLYLARWEGVLGGVPGNTFWLLKAEKGQNKPVVVFKTTADRIVIGRTDTSGYPPITICQQTATSRTDSTFHFSEGRYVLFRQYRTPHYQEQKSFNADDEAPTVEHPVPIPAAVFEILSKDDEFVQEALADHGWAIDQGPKNGWLTASLVSKKDSSGELYLVVGNGSLAGAHGTTFWLVKNDGGGRRSRILFKITTDQLEIGRIDASGYPVLTAVRETAVSMTDMIFHFVAGKYTLFRTKKDN
jgi:hypothetical protein